jgi:hypothetical protein
VVAVADSSRPSALGKSSESHGSLMRRIVASMVSSSWRTSFASLGFLVATLLV